jgi:hypothetical protein
MVGSTHRKAETMSTEAWIALLSLAFLVMSTTVGAALWLGRLIGGLRETMRDLIREHRRDCSAYDPNTGVRAHPSDPHQPVYPPLQRRA